MESNNSAEQTHEFEKWLSSMIQSEKLEELEHFFSSSHPDIISSSDQNEYTYLHKAVLSNN
jgi:hypothetical protein